MWYLCHFFLITLTVLLLLFFLTTLTSQHIFIHFRPFIIPQYLLHSSHNYVIILGFHHLTYILPSPFILLSHIYIFFTSLWFYSIFASPLYFCHNILYDFTPLFFFHLYYVSFYFTLSDIFLPISVSPPFNFPLLCLSVAYMYCLSHPPVISLHLIFAIFKIFFPHHHT